MQRSQLYKGCRLSLRSPGSQFGHVWVLLFLLSLGSLGFSRHGSRNVGEGNCRTNIQELLVKLLLFLKLQFFTEGIKLRLQFILIKLLKCKNIEMQQILH